MLTIRQLQDCLGGDWPELPGLTPKVIEIVQKDGYRLEKVHYTGEYDEIIPALLLIPDGITATRQAPAIVVWHQHHGEWELGKSEPAGLAGNPMHHIGVAFVKSGFIVLCPDAIGFEERTHPVLKGRDFEWFLFGRYIVEGKSLAWKNILDARRAIDYLCSRPEVNTMSIGCYGHSLGSTLTWLTGPFEERLRCLVGNCCLPTYESMQTYYVNHCASNYIPGLLQYGDVDDVAALIAPRPLHLNFGELDELSPINGVRKSIEKIRQAYQKKQAEEHFTWYIEEGSGHILSDEMWKLTLKKFQRYLL